MQTIEVDGKLYQVDTSKIMLGDFYRCLLFMEAKDSNKQVLATLELLKKAMGDQIDDIPVVYYSLVFGAVVKMMASPFSTSEVDKAIEEILEETEEDDEGA